MKPSRFAVMMLALMLSVGNAVAMSPGCHCSPCTCGTCHCGGGGGHHSHTAVGISVDVGSIINSLTRPKEPKQPSQPVAKTSQSQTQEKHKSKGKGEGTTTDPFGGGVKLTGREAKADNNPPTSANVSNDDDVPQPQLGPSGDGKTQPNTDGTGASTNTPVTTADLKSNSDAYNNARARYLEKQPNWKKIAHAVSNSPNTEQGRKESSEAYKQMLKLIDDFNQTDEGKKLIDNWKNAYGNAVKAGEKVPNSLLPPPTNEMEKKKYAVTSAQNNLQSLRDTYDADKHRAVVHDNDVRAIQDKIEGLEPLVTKDKPVTQEKVDAQQKLNQLKDDLKKAETKAGNDWASSSDAKAQMQKVHQAEQDVDKAKQAYKPFEPYEEKPAKAASNP